MKQKSLALLMMLVTIVLTNCSDDDVIISSLRDYENGVLVSHEGSFSGVSGSVSYISSDLSDVQNGIYKAINGDDLGIFSQSIGFNNDLAFIVVDNANSITVVNRYTFEKVATITTGLMTPRYITFSNDKAYVTNWGDTGSATDDFIAVVDLSDYTVSEITIPVSEGPEQIVATTDNIYVSHKGGFGLNNVVSVINLVTNDVQEIEVGERPDELAFDASGNLWILTEGNTVFNEKFEVVSKSPGTLVKLDTTTNTIATTINFSGTDQPSLMTIEEDIIYYALNKGIYAMSTSDSVLPKEAIVATGSLYGMNVKGSTLYTVDAGDFASDGSLKTFDLASKQLTNTFSLGVVPAKIYFN